MSAYDTADPFVRRMIDDIVRREKGYVNHPADRGGPTKYGITQRTLSRHRGAWVSVEEVKALTIDEAREIYLFLYLTGPKIDTLPDMAPAWLVPFTFDGAVNHGPGNAIRFVQNVVNDFGLAYIVSDGAIGPKTRGSVRATAERVGYPRFCAATYTERRNFYHAIVANDPSQAAFIDGWMNRLEEFRLPEFEQYGVAA